MKQENAEFLAALNRRKAARRRAVSLLLVLSMITSSGVSWALHGVGMTMANEPETEAESPPADETEESAEDGDDAETDSTEPAEADLTEDADAPPEDEDTEAFDEADETEDGVIYESAEEFLAAGDGDSGTTAGSEKPPTIETIDNIAEGIKFTLFDYGGSELDGADARNSYDYAMNWSAGVPIEPYEHNDISRTGINTGKNPDTDIMFFKYGTPPPHGEFIGYLMQDGHYVDWDGNQVEESDRIALYKPGVHDKNTYTGDYHDNSYQTGNRPFQGIVNTTLEPENDYYPTIAGSGSSLKYLFAPTTDVGGDQSEYKKVYEDVNHLLKKTVGEKGGEHLYFSSNDNYAYFNEETNEFEVYAETFRLSNDDHHIGVNDPEGREPDINRNTNEPYSSTLDENFQIGFFPFNEYDPTKVDPNWNSKDQYYNHHFGMTMEATFKNLPVDNQDVKEPITFQYSGDDDMWVFVDNQLVLDLGGIHEPAGGMIDFTNGLVWVQDNDPAGNGKTFDQVKTERHYSDEVWATIPKPSLALNTSSTSEDAENRWIVKPIIDFIPDWESGTDPNRTTHHINMFYLERGGCYSNLAMEMNLPTVKPLSVVKNVDKGENPPADEEIDKQEYWFRVDVLDTDTGQYIPLDNPKVSPNPFPLKAGARADFKDLESSMKYKIVELGTDANANGVDPGVFSEVTVNEVPQELQKDGEPVLVESTANNLNEVNAYYFTNKIRREETNLKVNKKWVPATPPSGYEKVKFKIFQEDSKNPGVWTQYAINGKRTFTLDAAHNWQAEFENLPRRYGDRVYSYKVEEQNVPFGYVCDVSDPVVSDDGTLTETTITNTDQSNVDIFVKKIWKHQNPQSDQVVLKLIRQKVTFEDKKPTDLLVRLVDEKGDEIGTYSTDAVYAGGSIEFSLDPNKLRSGVTIHHGDEYPKITTGSATFSEQDGIFEVKDLSEKTSGSSGFANVLEIRLDTDRDKPRLIYFNDFTGSDNNWENEWTVHDYGQDNRAKIGKARDDANNLDYLVIYNRDSSSDGMQWNASTLIPGHTYRIDAILQGDGPDQATQIKFTFDTINKPEGGGEYSNFQTIKNPGDPEYLTLDAGAFEYVDNYSKTYTVPEYADQEQMYMFFETPSGNGSFRLNQFKIMDISDIPLTDTGNLVVFDEDSVTEPLVLSSAGYQWDNEFNVAPITLPGASNVDGEPMMYHWTKAMLNEKPNTLYKYRLVEVSAGGTALEYDTEKDHVFAGDMEANHFMYEIAFSGNNVASNTKDTPITVTNDYLWYQLPATGGVGTDTVYGAGVLLILTGFMGGYALKKRERRYK